MGCTLVLPLRSHRGNGGFSEAAPDERLLLLETDLMDLGAFRSLDTDACCEELSLACAKYNALLMDFRYRSSIFLHAVRESSVSRGGKVLKK